MNLTYTYVIAVENVQKEQQCAERATRNSHLTFLMRIHLLISTGMVDSYFPILQGYVTVVLALFRGSPRYKEGGEPGTFYHVHDIKGRREVGPSLRHRYIDDCTHGILPT